MCDDCYDRAVEAATEAEDKAERYEKALADILVTSESYHLFTACLNPLTRTLIQDMAQNYADIAKKALEGDDV